MLPAAAIKLSDNANEDFDFGRFARPSGNELDIWASMKLPPGELKPRKMIKLFEVEAPSTVARTKGPHIVHSIERELKFFVPLDLLRLQVDSEGLDKLLIRSNYFPQENTRAVQKILEHLAGFKNLSPHTRANVSRLQMIMDDEGGKEYFLCIKGERRGRYGTERPEIPTKISELQYEKLLPYARDGELWKPRLLKTGYVFERDRTRTAVEIHIDFPDQAGLKAENYQEGLYKQHNLVTIDVELPYRRLERQLRAGHHNMEFIREENGAIELTLGNVELRKALSTRRLARVGVDKRVRTAIKTLHKMSRERLARQEEDDD